MPKPKLEELIADASITVVKLEFLHLDPENPRLPHNLQRNEKDILNYIATTTAVEDLVNAIATNDFFPGEPLIVVPDPTRGAGNFLVVEGNRRLTALRLLQNPRLIKEPSARLTEIVNEAEHKPTKIPVVVRQTRAEVLPYLGFRHITGVKAWDPLAKARYMKQLFDVLTKKNERPINRYKQIAQAIGSRSNNIRRNLDALAVYDVMEDAAFFDIPDLSEDTIKFGSLYTALADEKIGAFVGSAKATSHDEDSDYMPTHPIVDRKVLNKPHIKDLTRWMFQKNEQGETIVGESRNLRKLASVVANPASVKALRSGSKLDYAYRLTTGVAQDFAALLYEAEGKLREAAGLVATVDYDESTYQLAKQLGEYLSLIEGAMESKKKKKGR